MQATLIIKDEVNVKIQGLDLGDRKTLVNKFKYEIPGARYQPSVRLGRWDGKVSFFQLGGSTYINLLPEILPYLDSQGYDVEVQDLRTYNTNFTFKEIREDTFAHCNWPAGHPQAGEPIIFRDYQLEVINNFLRNPQSVQEVATGAGKCLAGDTQLTVEVDETTPFGKFLLNKLQQGQENDVTTNNQTI